MVITKLKPPIIYSPVLDDPFLVCPYFSSHRVPRSRMQRHLVKCEAANLSIMACPYNATHRYTRDKMVKHVLECPSRLAMFPEDTGYVPINGTMTTPRVIPQRDIIPHSDPDYEEWD